MQVIEGVEMAHIMDRNIVCCEFCKSLLGSFLLNIFIFDLICFLEGYSKQFIKSYFKPYSENKSTGFIANDLEQHYQLLSLNGLTKIT